MSERENHEPYITDAEAEFGYFTDWSQQVKWSFDTDIDLVVAAMIARATETTISMFNNVPEAPDNTLYLMLRNLFETAVRIRYLVMEPNTRICEFHLNDAKNRLAMIGYESTATEDASIASERQQLLPTYNKFKKQVAADQNETKPRILKLNEMCEKIGDSELYRLYRALSQFEHSTGVGLVNSVVGRNVRGNTITIDRSFDETEAELIWTNVPTLLKSVSNSVAILNSHRPNS